MTATYSFASKIRRRDKPANQYDFLLSMRYINKRSENITGISLIYVGICKKN